MGATNQTEQISELCLVDLKIILSKILATILLPQSQFGTCQIEQKFVNNYDKTKIIQIDLISVICFNHQVYKAKHLPVIRN